MSWQGIEGHDEIVEKFRRALAQGRLASTFLFVGPEGIGKQAFALRFAQALLCSQRDETLLDPCGKCPACVQVMAGTHPDLIQISKPPGKSEIPVGVLKGDDIYPVEQSLLFNLALRPFHGGRKVAIVDDADDLNIAGANALLKTLEEPSPCSVLILISTSADQQLPTIRSRAQIVRFKPLESAIVTKLLADRGVASDAGEAQRLASFSGGSVSKAAELADPELWKFRSELLEQLAKSPVASASTAQLVSKFVDEAGKEAVARRARLRLAMEFAAEFYRQLVHSLADREPHCDAELQNAISRAVARGAWNIELAADAAQRSLDAINQLERHANQSTLVESWLDDLASIGMRQVVAG